MLFPGNSLQLPKKGEVGDNVPVGKREGQTGLRRKEGAAYITRDCRKKNESSA